MFSISEFTTGETYHSGNIFRLSTCAGKAYGCNIGNHILNILLKHKIDLEHCRAQVYDGPSAMASKGKGASAVIKGQQPQAEFVHCRSHCINLAVVLVVAAVLVIRGFMAALTSVCFFFANSPKRQQYFEKFIDFHKELFKVSEINRTHIIGLSKTRWVERQKAYNNYFMLYKFVVSASESIVDIKLYSDFYVHLETESNKKWYWDQESQSKAQGLFSSCRRFDRLVTFAVLFNGLEPLKPLVTKLQKINQDIYHTYHMTDQVISDLKDTKRDIEN